MQKAADTPGELNRLIQYVFLSPDAASRSTFPRRSTYKSVNTEGSFMERLRRTYPYLLIIYGMLSVVLLIGIGGKERTPVIRQHSPAFASPLYEIVHPAKIEAGIVMRK